MIISQKVLRVGAIVAIAGATGFVMQARSPEALPLSSVQQASTSPTQPAIAPVVVAAAATDLPTPHTDTPVVIEQVAALASPETMTDTPSPAATPSEGCSADMALIPQPGAMLDLGMISPCRANQRVVIRHAGLAITGMTSAAGSLIASIPALQSPAEVTLNFVDGTTVTETVEIADLAQYDRFAIQWLEEDAFQLRAYPAGLEAGDAEAITAAAPGVTSDKGNYLLALGDATAPRPLKAEVYTWPAGVTSTEGPTTLAIEAAVTATTCGREIIGETLQLSQGALTLRDFSIEMPDCAAIGEFVALPNPLMTERLAAN